MSGRVEDCFDARERGRALQQAEASGRKRVDSQVVHVEREHAAADGREPLVAVVALAESLTLGHDERVAERVGQIGAKRAHGRVE